MSPIVSSQGTPVVLTSGVEDLPGRPPERVEGTRDWGCKVLGEVEISVTVVQFRSVRFRMTGGWTGRVGGRSREDGRRGRHFPRTLMPPGGPVRSDLWDKIPVD